MIDVKVSLTVVLPGSTMFSEQECSKQLKEVIKDKKGKVIRDKAGNIKTRMVPDREKHDCHSIMVWDKAKKEKERLTFYTRKCIPALQVLHISKAAYDGFIGDVVPSEFHAPRDFQPTMSPKLMAVVVQAWRSLTVNQRLEWHFERIASTLGGTVGSYFVLED